MEAKIKEALLNNSEALFGTAINESSIQFQKTRKDVEGDLTLVTFPFVKILRCSPVDAGNKIGAFLTEEIEEIDSCEAINGFLNIVLSDGYWLNKLGAVSSDAQYGFVEANSKPTVMVEYSSPNTNKPLHLGLSLIHI